MNIGVSTATFYPKDTLDSIDIIGQSGFKNIEIFVNTESEYERDYAQKLKEKLKYYGISVTSVHPYTAILEGIYFFSDYTKRTDDAIKIYTRYFEYANFMEAKFFTFHGEGNFLASFTENKANRDLETYKRLSNKACEKGIYLAQENVVRCNSQNIDFLENLYEKVPNLKFTLDIKQARRAKVDVFDYVDVMRDKLCNIHANDYTQEKDCVLPGMGIFNYDLLINKIKNYNYSGDLLLEVYKTSFQTKEELINSRNYLERKISTIC